MLIWKKLDCNERSMLAANSDTGVFVIDEKTNSMVFVKGECVQITKNYTFELLDRSKPSELKIE